MSFQTGTEMSYLNWGQSFSDSKHGKIQGNAVSLQVMELVRQHCTHVFSLGEPTILQNCIRVRARYENVLISQRTALLFITLLYLKIGPVGSSKTLINFYLLHGITFQKTVIFKGQSLSYHETTTWKINDIVVLTYELNLN